MRYTTEQSKAWGASGGRKRARKLSKRRRSEIARLGAQAKWAKAKKNGHE